MNQAKFLLALTKLCHDYGVSLEGQGCCGQGCLTHISVTSSEWKGEEWFKDCSRAKNLIGVSGMTDRVIHFGELLADEAYKRRVSQGELGRRVGMPARRINEIFLSANITERTFRKLCAALRVRLDVILTPGSPRPDLGVFTRRVDPKEGRAAYDE